MLGGKRGNVLSNFRVHELVALQVTLDTADVQVERASKPGKHGELYRELHLAGLVLVAFPVYGLCDGRCTGHATRLVHRVRRLVR